MNMGRNLVRLRAVSLRHRLRNLSDLVPPTGERSLLTAGTGALIERATLRNPLSEIPETSHE